MVNMIEVESSNIAAIGYDNIIQELSVKFKKSEQVYIYSGVPEQAYNDFLAAESKGKYFFANIKKIYPFRKE